MRMDLVTLRLFVAVVEHASISMAAEREHIAPSAASRRISELEELLKAKLLYRTPTGVLATPAGAVVLRRAKAMFRELQEMESEVSSHSGGVRGLVRIWANISSLIQVLPVHVASFKMRYPLVEIALNETTSQEIVKAVQEGRADLGIVSSSTPADSLITFPCWADQLVLAMPSGHPLSASPSVACAQALDYDLISLQFGGSIETEIRRAAHDAGKSMRVSVTVASFDPMARMVAAGVGIGVMPLGVAQQFHKILDFDHVPLSDAWSRRHLVMCSKPLDTLTSAAALFVTHLLGASDEGAPAEGLANGEGGSRE